MARIQLVLIWLGLSLAAAACLPVGTQPGAATEVVAATPTPTETAEPTETRPLPAVPARSTAVPTRTPVLTRTPGPPTRTAVPPVAVTRIVVNVRTGPGVGFPQLGRLDRGSQVTVIGKSEDGTWLQVPFPDRARPGWVAGEFVDLAGPIEIVPVIKPVLPPTSTATLEPTQGVITRTMTPAPSPTPLPPAAGRLFFLVTQNGGAGVKWLGLDKRGAVVDDVTLAGLPADLTQATNSAPLDWSPAVGRLVYVFHEGGQDKLRIEDGDGRSMTIDSHGGILSPRWSPDGQRVAYIGMDNPGVDGFFKNQSIYVTHADGAQREVLLGSRINQELREQFRGLAWSKKDVLAFVSNFSGRYEVWTVAPRSGSPTQLTREGASASAPAWSPDGTRLAYVSNKAAPSDTRIYVTGPEGSSGVPLAVGLTPAWSPDGNWVAFSRNGSLYIMDTFGGNLSTVLALGDHPVWAP